MFISVAGWVIWGPSIAPQTIFYAHVISRPDGSWLAKVEFVNSLRAPFQASGVIHGTRPDGHAEWVIDRQGTALPKFWVSFCGDCAIFAAFTRPRAAYPGHGLTALANLPGKAPNRLVNGSHTLAIPSPLIPPYGDFVVNWIAAN